MKNLFSALISVVLVVLICSCKNFSSKFLGFANLTAFPVTANYNVIPLPDSIVLSNQKQFKFTGRLPIFYKESDSLKREAEFLREYVQDITNDKHKVKTFTSMKDAGIYLCVDRNKCPKAESYVIDIDSSKIVVTGGDAAGVFYGIQTLRKSIPADEVIDVVLFPSGRVSDYPQFSYRGMHLDVSRHFMTLDSVKRYIDMMAMHNINKFHWHLTDDQGWRIEIDKYPKLTKVGAWRSGTVLGRNTNKYDNVKHGGFYTKAQLRELVEYAAERHITVIPEFDLPGHTQSLLAAYPQFGCTGGPYEVWKRWGVTDEVVCAGNEEAMQCLEDILNEIMDIFPSEIIHIGGDECPKTRWHECPKCQAKIKELHIKASGGFSPEDYLQSYVMNRMEKVVKARGRKIIGWDEVLDGNISQSAMIMSWRGTEGGIKAANNGHDVVMTPGDYLYFSQGQSLEPEKEPVFADGYLPVERVYSFNPMPDELSDEAKKHIVGVQANIWSEYIPYFKHAEYDALPRMAALAELQWCRPEKRDYKQFVDRCFRMADLYEVYNYNYATHIFDLQVDIKPDFSNKCITVNMSKFGAGDIYYTFDGSEPDDKAHRYSKPVEIRENTKFWARLIRKDGETDDYKCEFDFSKASMKPVKLKTPPHQNYSYAGAPTLVDGLHGNSNYRTGRWIGFWGTPLEATVDFQSPTEVSSVKFSSIIHINDWIYNPKSCVVMVSNDGKTFRKVASDDYPLAPFDSQNSIEKYELDFDQVKTRYVKVIITGHQLPETHTGYGYPAWLFVDEIEID